MGNASGTDGNRRYVSCGIIAVLLFLWVVWNKGLFSAAPESASALFGILCDGFSIPGVILAGAGIISRMALTGVYDILGYGGRYTVDHFRPKKDPISFYDYKVEKGYKRNGQWRREWLFVGGICLGLALLCLLLYSIL